MAKLISSVLGSLDGYFVDADGKFDWAAPDDEVHAFVNELKRPIGIYHYGRRIYETKVFWKTASTEAEEPAVFWDYAEIWRGGLEDRVLADASDAIQHEESDRARVRPGRGPAAEAVLDGRHLSGRRQAGGPGDCRRAGRRVPSLPLAGGDWWRQTYPVGQRPRPTRTAR